MSEMETAWRSKITGEVLATAWPHNRGWAARCGSLAWFPTKEEAAEWIEFWLTEPVEMWPVTS